MYTRLSTYLCTCKCIRRCIYMYMLTFICTCACWRRCIGERILKYMRIYIHMYMYIGMFIGTYMHMCIYSHTFLYADLFRYVQMDLDISVMPARTPALLARSGLPCLAALQLGQRTRRLRRAGGAVAEASGCPATPTSTPGTSP